MPVLWVFITNYEWIFVQGEIGPNLVKSEEVEGKREQIKELIMTFQDPWALSTIKHHQTPSSNSPNHHNKVLTPPLPVPSPDEKGGGLKGVGAPLKMMKDSTEEVGRLLNWNISAIECIQDKWRWIGWTLDIH